MPHTHAPGDVRARVRGRHRAERRAGGGADRLRPGRAFVALLADAVHNFGDVLGLVFAWGASRAGAAGADGRPHLRLGPQQHPGRPGQRRRPAGGHRRHRVEAVQRLLSAGDRSRAAGDGGGRGGIVMNGGTALMFMRGRHARPEHPRRLPAHGGRCGRVGRGAGGGLADHAHRRAVARPGGQPGDLRRGAGRQLGPAARCHGPGDGCGAARHRPGRGAHPAARPAGGDGGARPAHLGAVHHAHGRDGPPGVARRHGGSWCRWPASLLQAEFGIGHCTFQLETTDSAEDCVQRHDCAA